MDRQFGSELQGAFRELEGRDSRRLPLRAGELSQREFYLSDGPESAKERGRLSPTVQSPGNLSDHLGSIAIC